MSLIPLTQGQYALVDDADYEELSQDKWYAWWNPCTRSFYAVRTVRLRSGKKTTEYMHRRLLGLKRGDMRQIDHISHETLDNRRAHIRIVTASQNQHNNRCKGYYWSTQHKKYLAKIRVNGVSKYLGLYDTASEARAAYLAAKRVSHPTAPILGDD